MENMYQFNLDRIKALPLTKRENIRCRPTNNKTSRRTRAIGSFAQSPLAIFLILGLQILLFLPDLYAQAAGIGMEYEYPELLVTPSAVERLRQEAKAEDKNQITAYASIQASSALVLIAGMMSVNDGSLPSQAEGETPLAKWTGLSAISVGGGLLALTTSLSLTLNPYTTGWQKVVKSTNKKHLKTKRGRLTRQRAAEERLAAVASMSSKIKWISVVMNSLQGLILIQGSERNDTRVAGAIALLGSFAPLVFPSPYETTYDQHEEYKKKIYGPIAGVGFFFNQNTGTIAPALTLSLAMN